MGNCQGQVTAVIGQQVGTKLDKGIRKLMDECQMC